MAHRDELDDLIDDLFNDEPEESPEPIVEEKTKTRRAPPSRTTTTEPEPEPEPKQAQPEIKQESKEEVKETVPSPPIPEKPAELFTKPTETAPVPPKPMDTPPSKRHSKAPSSPQILVNPSPSGKKKKGNHGKKLLKDIRSFSSKKLRATKKSSDQLPVQNHKEAVLSLQQMAFRLYSLQQETTKKRQTLHENLVKYGNLPDGNEKQTIGNRISDIREALLNNELLMGNFEKNISAGQKEGRSDADTLADTAALERYLEQDYSENQQLDPKFEEPMVVSYPNVCFLFFNFNFILVL